MSGILSMEFLISLHSKNWKQYIHAQGSYDIQTDYENENRLIDDIKQARKRTLWTAD